MKHDWLIRLLVGTTLAVAAPIIGIAPAIRSWIGFVGIFTVGIAVWLAMYAV